MEGGDMKRKAVEDLEGGQPKKKGRNQSVVDETTRLWPPYFEHVRKLFEGDILTDTCSYTRSGGHLIGL